MAKITLIIILLLNTGAGFAQNYFVFIGSDNKQPFYVRVDSEFHSSTPEGHLILGQMRDSTYNITIGFPGQASPEQHYMVSIHGRDQALQLQQGQDGLRLYDLQARGWLAPEGGSVTGGETHAAGYKKDDAFSRMMAGVVHDTAVLYNTYAMEQALNDSSKTTAAADTRSPDTAANVAPAITHGTVDSTAPATAGSTTSTTTPLTDTSGAKTAAAIIHQPARTFNDSVAAAAQPKDTAGAKANSTTVAATPGTIAPNSASAIPNSAPAVPNPGTGGTPLYRPADGVTMLSERRSTRNVRLVYADHSGGKKVDTIVVIIPVDTPATAKGPVRKHAGDNPAATKTPARQPHSGDTTAVQAGKAHGPNVDSPVTSTGVANRPSAPVIPPAESPKTHPADSQGRQPKTVPFINSDCHDFATDFDVDKLRVKMLQASRDDDRVILARKTFKVKCFATRQIRTLSEVFTSDAGKFHFFEAAWPFAADEHFHELSDLLADPIYIGKFKTMTHMQ